MLAVSIVLYKTALYQISRSLEILSQANVKTITIIDNSPTNEVLDLIEMPSNVRYIHNPQNPGYGRSHNIALLDSMQKGIRYHLVLNADVYFDPGILKTLRTYMNRNLSIGLISPKVLYPDGSVQYLCKLIPTPWDLLKRRLNIFRGVNQDIFNLKFTGYSSEMEVPYLSGCFMFFRVDALRKVGIFDERFFMYPEDIDLSRRVNEQYRTVFYPKVLVYHEYGAASHKSLKMFLIHAYNLAKYFNKWGWFFDKKRNKTNQAILSKLKRDFVSDE